MQRIWSISLVILLALVGWFGDLAWYGVQQGIGQAKILMNTQEVSEVMADPNFPDSLKAKLEFIQEVREYAQDSLGLNDSENYTSIYDQGGKNSLWVVQACPEFSLEPFTWRYGFLGKLPYRGYFDSLKCVKLANELDELGYDVDVDPVQAWSTLGWFRDPILSNMLNDDEGMLARLIIHELTHSTLYVESDAEFNENLATFVGDQGAYLFLEDKYGIKSNEYRSYSGRMQDVDLFVDAAMREYKMLEQLYQSFPDTMNVETKRQRKQEFFNQSLYRFKRIPFSQKDRFKILQRDTISANNTYFMGLGLYRKQQSSMDSLFKAAYGSDFNRFMAGMKQEYGIED